MWSPAKLRGVRYFNILSGYRTGIVELLYEGSLPPRRHIARIFGDQLGLDVRDVRPSCVFDKSLIRQYQEAWADLPRPWIVVNRKSNNGSNKNWMGEHWDRLITSLLNRYTVIEIGAGGQGRPGAASALCGPREDSPSTSFLAAVAAGDIHVGPDSGPVHVAAAAGKPSVVIYGGYDHPDCSVIRKTSTFTPRCPAPRAGSDGAMPLRSRMSEPDLARAGRGGDRVSGPCWRWGVTTRSSRCARNSRGSPSPGR